MRVFRRHPRRVRPSPETFIQPVSFDHMVVVQVSRLEVPFTEELWFIDTRPPRFERFSAMLLHATPRVSAVTPLSSAPKPPPRYMRRKRNACRMSCHRPENRVYWYERCLAPERAAVSVECCLYSRRVFSRLRLHTPQLRVSSINAVANVVTYGESYRYLPPPRAKKKNSTFSRRHILRSRWIVTTYGGFLQPNHHRRLKISPFCMF
jgi:hypothetical protein